MGKQIKQMEEEAGVIEKSSSSYYNSPTTSFLRNRAKNVW